MRIRCLQHTIPITGPDNEKNLPEVTSARRPINTLPNSTGLINRCLSTRATDRMLRPLAAQSAAMITVSGEVAEWSNVPDSKSGVRVSAPWVRIPPSPPDLNPAANATGFFSPGIWGVDLQRYRTAADRQLAFVWRGDELRGFRRRCYGDADADTALCVPFAGDGLRCGRGAEANQSTGFRSARNLGHTERLGVALEGRWAGRGASAALLRWRPLI